MIDRNDIEAGGSLTQRAYGFIQQRIADGSFAAGSLISELTVARELGISRTPVREAIGRLQTEGLLESLPKRGTLVRRLDRNDLIELYEMREATESFAASRAAARIEPGDVDQLRELCERMQRIADELRRSGRRALDTEQMRRYLSLDMALHTLIIRAAGNSRIYKVVADSRLLTRVLWAPRQEHDAAVLDEAQRFHTRIVEHVAAGEGDEAGRVMAEHIRTSMTRALDHGDRERARRAMPGEPILSLDDADDTDRD